MRMFAFSPDLDFGRAGGHADGSVGAGRNPWPALTRCGGRTQAGGREIPAVQWRAMGPDGKIYVCKQRGSVAPSRGTMIGRIGRRIYRGRFSVSILDRQGRNCSTNAASIR